jgi:hypothetical protein
MVDLIEIPIAAEEYNFAETLVPLNPCRWPTFVADKSTGNEMEEVGDKIQTTFNNLIINRVYEMGRRFGILDEIQYFEIYY